MFSMLQNNMTLAFGSDWDVAPASPLQGILLLVLFLHRILYFFAQNFAECEQRHWLITINSSQHRLEVLASAHIQQSSIVNILY